MIYQRCLMVCITPNIKERKFSNCLEKKIVVGFSNPKVWKKAVFRGVVLSLDCVVFHQWPPCSLGTVSGRSLGERTYVAHFPPTEYTVWPIKKIHKYNAYCARHCVPTLKSWSGRIFLLTLCWADTRRESRNARGLVRCEWYLTHGCWIQVPVGTSLCGPGLVTAPLWACFLMGVMTSVYLSGSSYKDN